MSDPRFAQTPAPPYYAVIFSSTRTPGDEGYGAMADRMVELASRQPGFLGAESVRGSDGFGITVSYWDSPSAIRSWRDHLEHETAQRLGTERWYEHFELRVAKVERAYGLPQARSGRLTERAATGEAGSPEEKDDGIS